MAAEVGVCLIAAGSLLLAPLSNSQTLNERAKSLAQITPRRNFCGTTSLRRRILVRSTCCSTYASGLRKFCGTVERCLLFALFSFGWTAVVDWLMEIVGDVRDGLGSFA
jgi:hypothetical protein